MVSGYCPHCEKIVNAKREDFDICLAIILAIFTGGIGLIIYLIIWYSKEENRCIHCGSRLQPMELNYKDVMRQEKKEKNIPPSQNPYRSSTSDNRKSEQEPDIISGGESKYCPFCGEAVLPGTKYCPNCGSEMK